MPMYSWMCTHCTRQMDILRSFDDCSVGPYVEEVAKEKPADDGGDPKQCIAVGGHDWRRRYEPVMVSKWPSTTGSVKGRN